MKLLIYIPQLSPRITYSFKHVFKELLGIDYMICHDLKAFVSYNGPKFSYSRKTILSELHVHAVELLFEKGIGSPEVHLSYHKKIPCIFSHTQTSALPFDPFAAIFFFVSRYEEYQVHIRDGHNRYKAKESFAYQNQIIQLPVVDKWALLILEELKNKYPELQYKKRRFKAINTLDIDQTYAIREKGILRIGGIMLKAILKFNFTELKHIIDVLLKKKKDPFDTFDFIIENLIKYPLIKHYFFILMGEYGEFDKNIHPTNKAFQNLIKSLADYGIVGIHPSYRSNIKREILESEIKQLRTIIHREIKNSRQHFLKLELPKTYQNLVELGIKDEFTMGFAEMNGFRAGTCSSFMFYDLDLEYETPLRIHPFCIMEASLMHYQNLTTKEAKREINQMIEQVRAVQGTFVSIWHNESLSDKDLWKGWQDVYLYMLNKCSHAME